MPTYQYKCRQCEHRFEVIQKITEAALTECPECQGEIRRVLFPAGVVFKGSGWYVTDYRNSGEKAKYESESKGETASASTETKPSETKTADSGDKGSETKTESAAPKTESAPASAPSNSEVKAA